MQTLQNISEKAAHKIEEINLLIHKFIDGDHIQNQIINFMNGLPGAALFLYQYAQYRPEKANACYEKIALIIDNAFEYINQAADAKTSFCNGITGTLWLIEFMRKKKVVDIDDDYLSPGMIEYLSSESLTRTINRNHCDLLYGGFGFWAFLLESGEIANKHHLVKLQLNALNKIAVDTPNGRNWKINGAYFGSLVTRNMAAIDPATSVNLSMAHGICAILILLAKTKMSGYAEKETEDNIHRGLQLVSSLKINDPRSVSLYPTIVTNGEPLILPRIAWRYGDLCVAVAFWMAWKATGYHAYKDEALFIMDFSYQKYVDPKDAGLSNGAAGIAHIFRRFYWETGNIVYENAADKWIAITLKMAVFSDGYAGYKAFNHLEGGQNNKPEYGLLQGIAGIGLTLLSSLSDKPSDWDRALQIC
jgi:lantibiotic biosynthesis protein